MKNKNVKLNPVLPRNLALLFEPFLQSAVVFHLYFLYLFLKLYMVNFDPYLLAKNSAFANLLQVDHNSKLLLYSWCLFQYSLTTCLVLTFINNYVSAGSRLPEKLKKNTNLKGKVAIVTGGYSGIGYETVLQLLKWNCNVVIFGRDKTKATNAVEKLKATNSFDPFVQVDLDDLTSVRNAVQQFNSQFDRLDFLINNAGVYTKGVVTTNLKLEANFSTNFLGHFYLTSLLFDLVNKSEGRVINVSSVAHHRYKPETDPIFETKSTTSLPESKLNTYYGRSKMFNLWFAHALQRRFKDHGSKAVSFSLAPGVIMTNLTAKFKRSHIFYVPKFLSLMLLKRPVDGAATTLHLCATKLKDLVPGGYYNDRRLAFVSKAAHDYDREEKLWRFGEELVEKYA